MGMYRRLGNGRIDTVFLFESVDSKPACVAVITWPVLEVDDLNSGCESRRRPGPSLNGADAAVEGRRSEGTLSLGRSITGDDMTRKGRIYTGSLYQRPS